MRIPFMASHSQKVFPSSSQHHSFDVQISLITILCGYFRISSFDTRSGCFIGKRKQIDFISLKESAR